jgi:hypothetical protein
MPWHATVKKGVRWSIGDGKRVTLLIHNWITNVLPASFKTPMPIPDGALLDEVWFMVHSVFDEEVANLVLKVHVSRRNGPG